MSKDKCPGEDNYRIRVLGKPVDVLTCPSCKKPIEPDDMRFLFKSKLHHLKCVEVTSEEMDASFSTLLRGPGD